VLASFGALDFFFFIPDTPHKYASVIAVALDKVFKLLAVFSPV